MDNINIKKKKSSWIYPESVQPFTSYVVDGKEFASLNSAMKAGSKIDVIVNNVHKYTIKINEYKKTFD